MQPTSQFHDGIGIAEERISEDVFDDVASERLFQNITQPVNPQIRLPLTKPEPMPLHFLERISLQVKQNKQ